MQWALGLPNFLPSPRGLNASYWSLIVEVHFYIILPFLFLLTRGLKPRRTAALLFFILFAAPLVARQLTWPERALSKEALDFLMSRFPCQLDFFAWGVLFSGVFVSLAAVRSEVRTLSLFGYLGLVLLLASLGFRAICSHLFDIHDHPARWSTEVFHLLPSVSAFLMLFFVFDPKCIGARLLSTQSLRFVGVVSYEWFLFHQPVVNLFREIFGNTRGNPAFYVLKTILPLALTFGFSVIVYRYFSLPLMNRIRGSRPNTQGRVNGAQPVGSDTNSTSAAASYNI
jgi:peptidoglycan/LPS O-acetylase OafA/YrhL